LAKAVSNVNDIIAPVLKGADATKQREIDNTMVTLDGTPTRCKLGGYATAAVSAAVLKAGADSLGIPLYQHIGGVNACLLPTPGVTALLGSNRYGGGLRSGGKPTYSFMCYGFDTFSEASYGCWEVKRSFEKIMFKKYNESPIGNVRAITISPGVVSNDEQLWEDMATAINVSGNKGKVGIQVDVAATTYYDTQKEAFVGIFSNEDKSKDDMVQLYRNMVKKYPFIVIEDPLEENDFEGHALLTRELGIQIVGDDLFATNTQRLMKGIKVGACNAVLLKVNQIGTISDAFDMVQLAYRNGYGVMPCGSRGEGPTIGDYAVGLSTGNIRESGLDVTANRLLQIESELGSRAKFLGKAGFKP